MISVDPKITKAIEDLDEELEVFEQQTGSQCTLILIPHYSTQPIYISVNGRMIEKATELDLEEIFRGALKKRLTDFTVSRKGQVSERFSEYFVIANLIKRVGYFVNICLNASSAKGVNLYLQGYVFPGKLQPNFDKGE